MFSKEVSVVEYLATGELLLTVVLLSNSSKVLNIIPL